MAVNTSDDGPGEARELAVGLRALRGQARKSTRELGRLVGISAANISNWERGERLPSEERVIQLLDALDASTDERERLLGLRRQIGGPGQLVPGTPSIGRQLTELIQHEQVARRITDVAPLVFPGLLQTSDYARATLQGYLDIDTRVALRVGRRDVLTRTRNPAELVALIDSEVLVRPIASPPMMVDQLHHLLKMAALPNVTVQLINSTTIGYNPLLAGPFILMEFASASPIVHLEHYMASAFLWEEKDVAGFMAAVQEIREQAMTPARSAEVIAEIVEGMEK